MGYLLTRGNKMGQRSKIKKERLDFIKSLKLSWNEWVMIIIFSYVAWNGLYHLYIK